MLIVRRGGNKAGCLLELVVFAKGGHQKELNYVTGVARWSGMEPVCREFE